MLTHTHIHLYTLIHSLAHTHTHTLTHAHTHSHTYSHTYIHTRAPGKTAQTICFLGVLSHLRGVRGPHIIVTPASLIDNWQRELMTWCPRLRCGIAPPLVRRHTASGVALYRLW